MRPVLRFVLRVRGTRSSTAQRGSGRGAAIRQAMGASWVTSPPGLRQAATELASLRQARLQ